MLSYAPFLGAQLLATPGERTAVADFIVGLFLSRIPILLFQAVQAALLPRLAAQVSSGQTDDFRRGMRNLIFVVSCIGLVGVIGGATLGPPVGHILFGNKFELGNLDLALLAAGSGMFILALTLVAGVDRTERAQAGAGVVGRRCRRVHRGDGALVTRPLHPGRDRIDHRRRRGARRRWG